MLINWERYLSNCQSFTVKEIQNTEEFLDRIPTGYNYAVEFRLSSWNTEGPGNWEMPKFLD